MTEEQWYSNKDLFEQINELKEEMRETRTLIKQYNGIREKVDLVANDVNTLKALNTGRAKVLSAIREWGGWVFALITLLILLKNNF